MRTHERREPTQSKSRHKMYLALGAIVLVVLTILGLRLVVGPLPVVIDIILSIPPEMLLQVLAFIVAGEAVRAARLVVLARLMGHRLGLTGALIARLVGRWAALLSPASSASTPLRAGVIGAYSGMSIGAATGLAIIETIYDLILPVVMALIIGLVGLPETWILLLVSAVVAALWTLGVAFARTPTVEELVLRVTGRREWWCYARRQRLVFLEILRGGISARILAPGLLLTLVAHALEALAVGAALRWSGEFVWWFIVLEVSYALSMAPTPGGALVFEYGLEALLDPRELVAWRASFIIAGLLPGTLILVLVPRMRAYLASVARGIEDCGYNGSHSSSTPPRDSL
ncbi:MAG: flippase-like domain-containing protein [Desulfurococcales archaeon]|nr:flippase-like domain-containing protein [Desulfurococcales archaeon]